MKCPICESMLRPGATRCPDCGYRIPGAQTAPQQSASGPRTSYTPPNKSNRTTGCCCFLILLPLFYFLLAGLFALGEVIVEEIEIAVGEFGIYEEEPFEQVPGIGRPDLTPESIPAPANDSCFVLLENSLMFVPENWDGSPILRIPETVNGQSVTAIGPGCFADCTDLTTIILPDSVTSISPMAFSGCSKLRGLYLPDGVVSIGQDAFRGCVSLEAICIPASVTYIAEHNFDDCAALLYIMYDGNFEEWDALYGDYINPFTAAICLDGSYYHGSGD